VNQRSRWAFYGAMGMGLGLGIAIVSGMLGTCIGALVALAPIVAAAILGDK